MPWRHSMRSYYSSWTHSNGLLYRGMVRHWLDWISDWLTHNLVMGHMLRLPLRMEHLRSSTYHPCLSWRCIWNHNRVMSWMIDDLTWFIGSERSWHNSVRLSLSRWRILNFDGNLSSGLRSPWCLFLKLHDETSFAGDSLMLRLWSLNYLNRLRNAFLYFLNNFLTIFLGSLYLLLSILNLNLLLLLNLFFLRFFTSFNCILFLPFLFLIIVFLLNLFLILLLNFYLFWPFLPYFFLSTSTFFSQYDLFLNNHLLLLRLFKRISLLLTWRISLFLTWHHISHKLVHSLVSLIFILFFNRIDQRNIHFFTMNRNILVNINMSFLFPKPFIRRNSFILLFSKHLNRWVLLIHIKRFRSWPTTLKWFMLDPLMTFLIILCQR